jgi:hypothetical protein
VFSPIFGQNEIENADEFPSEERISQNDETQDDISQDSQSLRNNAAVRDSILLESQEKKVRNHRYIVVSAVMMMLFVGLCMASVSSLNPE